jgi:hypothetical protein
MKTAIYVVGACALFALQGSPAQAGACTGEIGNLTKMMSASDAGSGPTSGAPQPGAIAGAASPSARPPQQPPTELMGREAQGRAAAPEDVRRQTEGRPTTAEQAQSGRSTGSTDKAAASAALDRARAFDRDGKEAECMDAIQQAKRLLGS